MGTLEGGSCPERPGSFGAARTVLGLVGVALLAYSISFYRNSIGFVPPDPVVSIDSAAVLVPMGNLIRLATEETTFQSEASIEVTADVPAWWDGHYLLIARADYQVRFGFDAARCRAPSVGARAPDGSDDAIVLEMPRAEILSIEMVTGTFRITASDLRTCSARDVDDSFEARIPDMLDQLRTGVEFQAGLSQGFERAEDNFTELAEVFYEGIGFEEVEVRFADGGSI